MEFAPSMPPSISKVEAYAANEFAMSDNYRFAQSGSLFAPYERI